MSIGFSIKDKDIYKNNTYNHSRTDRRNSMYIVIGLAICSIELMPVTVQLQWERMRFIRLALLTSENKTNKKYIIICLMSNIIIK